MYVFVAIVLLVTFNGHHVLSFCILKSAIALKACFLVVAF